MEELVLNDPVVVPEKTTTKYKVTSLVLNYYDRLLPTTPVAGYILIDLKDNNNEPFHHQYEGQEAIDFMKFMNTANFSVNSMHKRILQKLSNDGVLPGTVTGTPDT